MLALENLSTPSEESLFMVLLW